MPASATRAVTPQEVSGSARTVTLVHGGTPRTYVLHVPPLLRGSGTLHESQGTRRTRLLPVPAPREPSRTSPGQGLPMVLGLHGRGIDAAWFDRLTAFSSLSREEGFVLVLPNAVHERWNDGRDASLDPHGPPRDVAYLAAVIDDVCARTPIDPRRVYAVGLSNGATMAARLACELADRIAGIVQVAGTAAVDVAANCHPVLPVPILNVHGTADPFAPYAGGIRHGLRGRLLLRPAGRPMVGVDAWARFWAAVNECDETPSVTSPAPRVSLRMWHGPTPASDVSFCRVEGGGHTWPGGRPALPRLLFGPTVDSFSATLLAWEFLAIHAR